MSYEALTHGSLFAGIGGFDLGFENAGWKTVWQVELDFENRACLAERFPSARQLSDVRTAGRRNLEPVACVTIGFPCQDISVMGTGGQPGKICAGLSGERSGLFHEAIRIVNELDPKPAWVVLENVPRLLTINAGRDFECVVRSLAQRGYLGFWRVLDAQYFGVPQRRRRLFMVCGLGRYPCAEFLADSAPVASISSKDHPGKERHRGPHVGYTLSAPDKSRNCHSRYCMGAENFVAEEDGWDSMLERSREVEADGLLRGLAPVDLAEAWAAGNAVCPAVAQWIAEILRRS